LNLTCCDYSRHLAGLALGHAVLIGAQPVVLRPKVHDGEVSFKSVSACRKDWSDVQMIGQMFKWSEEIDSIQTLSRYLIKQIKTCEITRKN
jgi:hypothetical protein